MRPTEKVGGGMPVRGGRRGDLGDIENDRVKITIEHLRRNYSYSDLASLLGVTEIVVRDYARGQKAKMKADEQVANQLENRLGLPRGIHDPQQSPPHRFNAFLKEIQERPIGKPGSWFYGSFWQERLEEALKEGQAAIIVSPDCYNDGEREYTRDMVTRNALRGVEYHYIIPSDAPHKSNLINLVEFIAKKTQETQSGKRPRIHERETLESSRCNFWQIATHVCIFMDPIDGSFVPNHRKINIGNREFSCFAGMREIYLHSDKFDYYDNNKEKPARDFCWSAISSRELRYYTSFINDWKIA